MQSEVTRKLRVAADNATGLYDQLNLFSSVDYG